MNVTLPEFSSPLRTPSHLTIFDPVLIDSVPFMATCKLYNPMAVIIIRIGHFLDEAHELGKIVEVGEHGIDLVNRRSNRDRY